jgi:putative peptidoglycan lipid II flippase
MYNKLFATFSRIRESSLFKNFLIVGVITLLVKIVAFFKETLIASSFGLSEFLDSYFIAILVPSFIQFVFIGALKVLFIPNYVIETRTTKQLGSFQSFTLVAITILVIVLSICTLVFANYLLEYLFPGHDIEFYTSVRKQIYIVLPSVLFWGYSGFLGGLLEIKNKFLVSTLSQVFTPLTVIVFILFFKDFFGDYILATGITIGGALSFLFLLVFCVKQKILKLDRLIVNKNIQLMIQQYKPKIISGILSGMNPFVDQYFAAQLAIGSIAAIEYGVKIPTFVVGILMIVIGNVLLPHFSKLVIDDLQQAFQQLFKFLKIIFGGSIIMALVVIFLSHDIIALLFERNEFTTDDTLVVGSLQQIAFLYVPFFLTTLINVKFLTAINKNVFMAKVSFLNLVLNLVFNVILVKYYDIYGLVLATTIVYVICSIIYIGYLHKLYKKDFGYN